MAPPWHLVYPARQLLRSAIRKAGKSNLIPLVLRAWEFKPTWRILPQFEAVQLICTREKQQKKREKRCSQAARVAADKVLVCLGGGLVMEKAMGRRLAVVWLFAASTDSFPLGKRSSRRDPAALCLRPACKRQRLSLPSSGSCARVDVQSSHGKKFPDDSGQVVQAKTWQGHLPLDQVAQSPVQPDLECFQGWGIYQLPGQPVLVFRHPRLLKGHKKVSPEPSLPQAEQPQLSQPVLIRELLCPSDRFCGPPLDLFQQVHVFPVLRIPELAGYGWPGLRVHVAGSCPAFHPPPKVLFHRAALNPFIPQPLLIPGVPLTQDLVLGLVEPHEVRMGPLLKLVQVPLDGILSLRLVNCTTQLGVICKLAEGALDPAVYVSDEDIKQYWSQYRPLRDTTPVDRYSLDATIQPIPHPPNSPPIKSFDQQVLTHPCWSLTFLSPFLTPGYRELLRSTESVLKDLPALFCSLVPEGSFPGELDAPAHHSSSSLIRAAPQAVQGRAAAQDPQRKLMGDGI
ncbi:LOW QUALITY PROTEIN: hypothetical protein QYF61_022581, partial [Mycteria americana]